MTKELLCTLGPASMNDRVIGRLTELGVALFRINLSHTALDELPSVIRFVQDRTNVPVCLDSEGAQVRTGDFIDSSIRIGDNTHVTLHNRRVPGDCANWNLYPRHVVGELRVGDILSIDFNAVLIQVVETADDGARARVLNGGMIGRNKAVTLRRDIPLPPLTEKDVAALAIGLDMGIGDYALSFANSGEDVDRTRNAIHRVHEHLILDALERTGADGVYVNPVTGVKKSGDFLPEPIMQSYQATLDFGYLPRDKVVLGGFSTYSRYAGPREAVFTALCRKNMGCSHFIVGRDHTGVGNFYDADANRALFDALGDIGIAPVFFDALGFDPETGAYCRANASGAKSISGGQARAALRAGEPLPDWFMRDVVQDVLRGSIEAGGEVFVP